MQSKQAKKQEHLYSILDRGDRKIIGIKKQGIAIVGLTRKGKSTLFNWIMGKSMKGVKQLNSAVIYTCDTKNEGAEMDPGFTSVTLVPNITDLTNDDFLADMAGFKDERDYAGVIGVSYMLKALFDEVERIKFILVIDEADLKTNLGNQIKQTLGSFLQMFSILMLKKFPEIRQLIYSSVSLVITKVTAPMEVNKLIEGIIANFTKSAKTRDQYREYYAEFLQAIMKSNRIDYFMAATPDNEPAPCDIIQRFNEYDWKYVEIKDVRERVDFNLISLPFKEDFNALIDSEQQGFQNAILDKEKSYEEFAKIIHKEVLHCLTNWKDENIKHQQFFEDIREYLIKYDFYGTIKLIKEEELSTDIKIVKHLSLGVNLLKIFKIISNLCEQHSDFQEKMKMHISQFKLLIDILKGSLCQSQEDERLMQRLGYVLNRGFRQFAMLFEISEEHVSGTATKIKDHLQSCFDKDERQMMEVFIIGMTEENMQQIFSTIQLLDEYDQFLNSYEELYGQYMDSKAFLPLKISVKVIKAKFEIDNQKYKEGLTNLLSAFESVEHFQSFIEENHNDDDGEALVNDMYMKKLQIIDLMKVCLMKIPNGPYLALDLCKHVNDMDSSCEIYDFLLKSELTLDDLKEYLESYANYCFLIGRREDANKLLQKLLSKQKTSFSRYKEIKDKLFKQQQDAVQGEKDYKDFLSNWENIENGDEKIKDIFERIRNEIL